MSLVTPSPVLGTQHSSEGSLGSNSVSTALEIHDLGQATYFPKPQLLHLNDGDIASPQQISGESSTG